jgi:pimeloyl-ACP methyl ester carboxylesterase
MTERFEVTAGDGWRLSVRHFRAQGSGRRALLCGHAMMTDGAYFTRAGGFAAYLSARGFDVFVPDFRGHGASGPTAGEGGRWSFDDLAAYDWPALRAAAAQRAACGEAELAVLGHSLGGLVTVAHASRSGAAWARTVLLSANIWRMPRLRLFPDRLRAAALVRVLDRFAAAGRVLPVRRLKAGNADEAPAYVRQFVQWTRTGEFRALDGFDYESALESWAGPAMAVAGTGDWMCSPEGARDFVRRAGGRIPVVVEGPPSGLAFAPDHFTLLTRPDARPFWERLAAFLG